MYNITNITNSTNIVQLYIAINQLSNQLLSGVFLLCLFIIIMVSFNNYPKDKLFLGASFITSFIAILLFSIQAIGWVVLSIPILIFFGALVYTTFVE